MFIFQTLKEFDMQGIIRPGDETTHGGVIPQNIGVFISRIFY